MPYKIGDTVYTSHGSPEKKQIPCPDCLGTKVWKCITPAGEEFDLDCRTCQHGWEIRGFVLEDAGVTTERLTICRVTREEDRDGNMKYEYMATETSSGGSGSIYTDGRLFDTTVEARAYGEKQHTSTQASIYRHNREHRRKDARRVFKSYTISEIRKACLELEGGTASELYTRLTGYGLREARKK